MRLFVCSTIKAPNYTALTYKSHTVAVYKDGRLVVGNLEGFAPYVLDNLREFIINECRWVHRALNYPLDDEELKEALNEGIRDRWILCMED